MMVKEAWQQVREAAGHVRSAVRKQRVTDDTLFGEPSHVCSFQNPVHKALLPTFRLVFQPRQNVLEIPSPTPRGVFQGVSSKSSQAGND